MQPAFTGKKEHAKSAFTGLLSAMLFTESALGDLGAAKVDVMACIWSSSESSILLAARLRSSASMSAGTHRGSG